MACAVDQDTNSNRSGGLIDPFYSALYECSRVVLDSRMPMMVVAETILRWHDKTSKIIGTKMKKSDLGFQ